jgi:hypothetical protein
MNMIIVSATNSIASNEKRTWKSEVSGGLAPYVEFIFIVAVLSLPATRVNL